MRRAALQRVLRQGDGAVEPSVLFDQAELAFHVGQRLFRLAQGVVHGLAGDPEALRDLGEGEVLLHAQAHHLALLFGQERAIEVQQHRKLCVVRGFHALASVPCEAKLLDTLGIIHARPPVVKQFYFTP